MEGKSAKESKMIAQERRQRIFEDIETSGIASVRDLAKRFEVSHITIMRDLQCAAPAMSRLSLHANRNTPRRKNVLPPKP